MCLVSRVSPSYIRQPTELTTAFLFTHSQAGCLSTYTAWGSPKAYDNPAAGPHSQSSSWIVCICDKFPRRCWSWKPHWEPLTSKIRRSRVQCQTRETTPSKTTARSLKGEPSELKWLDSVVLMLVLAWRGLLVPFRQSGGLGSCVIFHFCDFGWQNLKVI